MPKLDKIQHPNHPHLLWHKPIKTLYKCNGCEQLGFRMCYRCKRERCDYQLHKECARASDTNCSNHSFFPKHVLLFRREKPHRLRSCKACGDGVPGFRYKAWHRKAHQSSNPFWLLYQHCSQKALHPCCAQLPSWLHGGGDLVLTLDKNKRRTQTCIICNNEKFSRGVKGWAYVSSCRQFSYHVACVKRRMEEDLERRSLDNRQRRMRMAQRIGLEAARLALELIVDAILGFPTAPLGVVMESLLN